MGQRVRNRGARGRRGEAGEGGMRARETGRGGSEEENGNRRERRSRGRGSYGGERGSEEVIVKGREEKT